jgi:hypothetical protein
VTVNRSFTVLKRVDFDSQEQLAVSIQEQADKDERAGRERREREERTQQIRDDTPR